MTKSQTETFLDHVRMAFIAGYLAAAGGDDNLPDRKRLTHDRNGAK